MKKFFSFLVFLTVTVVLFAQNNPVAVNDTATTMSEHTVAVNVLENDYDPDGDLFELFIVENAQHGSIYHDDSTVYYTPSIYTGLDSMQYRIREIDNHNSLSDYTWVFFEVNENPNLPIATDDHAEIIHMVPTELSILDNDSDPNGDEIIIDEAYSNGFNFRLIKTEIAEDSLSIIVTSLYPLRYNVATITYRIKEKNTADTYYSNWATVAIDILNNSDIPTAVDDHANTIGGEAIDILALENDINPGGSELSIDSVWGSAMGVIEIINNHVKYTPNYSAKGIDTIEYKIQLTDQPYLYDFGQIIIEVASNSSRPVAVDDERTGVCGEEIIVEVLENDYDPEGAELEIKDAKIINRYGPATTQISGARISVVPYFQGILINTEKIKIAYRVMEKDNPESYSEWATVTIYMEQDSSFPILAKDYATVIAGYPTEIDILANDHLNDTTADLSVISYNTGYWELDDKCTFTSYMTVRGIAKMDYRLIRIREGFISYGEIEINIESNKSYDSLNINNISAGIHSDGFLFSRFGGPSSLINYNLPYNHFEYPKGSGKHTIFSNSLWIGGIDQDDSLHFAGQRYKQIGLDYQFGPISNNYDGFDFFAKWSRTWKISKQEISYHQNNYWKDTYEPVDAIINWPGNGDVSNGQAAQLAPYFDKNENGIYEPMSGDYPLIRGDQSIFFIFNDDRPHTETQGGSLHVEIHGMAYAFDNQEDKLLNNTIFIHYDVFNRSENTYNDAYFGIWTDIDLGYARDDYCACNVGLGTYYGYNGSIIDGYGEPDSYGTNPPTQGVTIVAGPFMDDDGSDNSAEGCNNSINGLNFGDGIVDNERLGMTRFVYHNNGGNPSQSDPEYAHEYYNLMNGFWKDDSSIMYGGTGHFSSPSTVGPECNFMFPGESDPCNWGTDGIFPNDGYNQNGKYWIEETGDNGRPNPPEDRRGLGVTGPFTFEPGERQELDLAYSVGQGDNGPKSSVTNLLENITDLFERVKDGQIIIPSDQLSVEELSNNNIEIKIYPNPGTDIINIKIQGNPDEHPLYVIYNNMGHAVLRGQLSVQTNNIINVQELDQGFYFITIKHQGSVATSKFIKM